MVEARQRLKCWDYIFTRYNEMACCLVASFENEGNFCRDKLLVIFSIEDSVSVVALPARKVSIARDHCPPGPGENAR